MRRLVPIALGLLVLFFAADNVRLRDQLRPPERPPVATARTAAPEPSVEAPQVRERPKDPTTATPAPQAPAAPEAVDRKPAGKIQVLDRLLADDTGRIVWSLAGRERSLNLTEPQKKLIEGLKKNRDARTKVYRDLIQRIEDEAAQAIRQLLDPEQAKAYDAQDHAASFVLRAAEPTPVPQGSPSSYLGISGSDAEGGGASIGEVLDGTAAVTAGLQTGDTILEFNGEPIANYGALAAKIRETAAGTSVVLKIRRGDAVFQQGVQLGSR